MGRREWFGESFCHSNFLSLDMWNVPLKKSSPQKKFHSKKFSLKDSGNGSNVGDGSVDQLKLVKQNRPHCSNRPPRFRDERDRSLYSVPLFRMGIFNWLP